MSAGVIERESVVGAVVLIVAMGIMALAYSSSAHRAMAGYDLQASFAKAEGVAIGTDVRLAGVDVGKVVAQRLDDHFQALLTLRLAPNIKLPKDSAALIETDGLLGAKFVALQAGSDDDNLKPGGKFQFTQSSMNVNDILEMIISQAKSIRAGKPPATAKPAQ